MNFTGLELPFICTDLEVEYNLVNQTIITLGIGGWGRGEQPLDLYKRAPK
jgi:hypothetical protein